MWLDGLTLSTVIVHTKSGESIKGVKSAVHDDCIVLREAFMLGIEGQTALGGDVPIPRENVAFMQVVPS